MKVLNKLVEVQPKSVLVPEERRTTVEPGAVPRAVISKPIPPNWFNAFVKTRVDSTFPKTLFAEVSVMEAVLLKITLFTPVVIPPAAQFKLPAPVILIFPAVSVNPAGLLITTL